FPADAPPSASEVAVEPGALGDQRRAPTRRGFSDRRRSYGRWLSTARLLRSGCERAARTRGYVAIPRPGARSASSRRVEPEKWNDRRPTSTRLSRKVRSVSEGAAFTS